MNWVKVAVAIIIIIVILNVLNLFIWFNLKSQGNSEQQHSKLEKEVIIEIQNND
ncbi:Uncharacterised protein [Lysinibacillus sphaericus]|uniref:Uncharacterized protein n=1 Tax=Lysinibacillus sphaericus TaxID=1421 RepID=A0AAJ5DA38_LYSSH|nr:hypothetical protein LSP03_09260 [Lysinibacillus sphaericus]SUV17612.1 Uncharacterised protein [Lysinibacillus sphaericus]